MQNANLIAEGGLYGHLSHLYDFSDEVPALTFAEIEDIFIKVSEARLQVGEKLDGQTMFITFVPHETDAGEGAIVMAMARKADVLTAPQAVKDPSVAKGSLPSTIERFAGRNEELRNAFVDSLTAIDTGIKKLDLESQRAIFGPDAEGDYNWFAFEIMDPENPNVVNYNKYGPILAMHVEGHGTFSSRTREKKVNLSPSEEVNGVERIVYEKPVKLFKQAFDRINRSLEKQSRFKVMSNEFRNLQRGFDASAHIQKLNQEISKLSRLAISKESNIADYALARILDEYGPEIVSSFRVNEDASLTEEKDLEPLTSDFMQALDKETYDQYSLNIKALIRTILDGRSRKKMIFANLSDKQKQRVEIILNKARNIKIDVVSPIEMIVHDFAVEALDKFESAFVLSQDESTENFRQMISKDISQIQTGFDDPDSPLYGDEKKRAKFDRQKGKVRDITTSAEGFTFVYKGHWYKFTGNFAPLNQILGMKPGKFVREQKEHFGTSKRTFIFIPGGFKPPHADHWKLVTKSLQRYPDGEILILVGGKARACNRNHCITAEMSRTIWGIMIQDYGLSNNVEVQINDQPVKFIYEAVADRTAFGDTVIGVYGTARGADGRYKTLQSYAPKGVKVKELAVKTKAVEEGGASGTGLRELIVQNKPEEFFSFMPAKLSDRAKEQIWNIVKPPQINESMINEAVVLDDIFQGIEKAWGDIKGNQEEIENIRDIVNDFSKKNEDYLETLQKIADQIKNMDTAEEEEAGDNEEEIRDLEQEEEIEQAAEPKYADVEPIEEESSVGGGSIVGYAGPVRPTVPAGKRDKKKVPRKKNYLKKKEA